MSLEAALMSEDMVALLESLVIYPCFGMSSQRVYHVEISLHLQL